MRKLVAILAVAFSALAWTGVASAANGDQLRQITANTNGTACGDNAGGFKVGVGIAFDGTNLLVSCYNDSTVTAVSPVDGSQVAIHPIFGASSLGALAWDNGRGLLWACSGFNQIGTIDLITNAFTPVFSGGCFDGLAYDGSDDTIWASDDAASTTEHYTITGTLLSSHSWGGGLGSYGNSGIAVGGPLLYLANDGGSSIYTSPKDFSSAPAFFATFPRRLEDMECDNINFPGVGAMWSKDAYDNVLNAWEIPNGSCIFGGGRSEVSLTPSDATNDVGTQHTVTANVSDRNGPVAGGNVLFTVSGANTASGSGTTNASGDATFMYTGTTAGDDTITACYDKDNSGTCDSGEPTATATKHWIVRNANLSVVKTGPALVQDGGSITYTVAVTNNGPATAQSVVMTDAIPSEITGAAATPSQGSCSGSFTCNLGDIASGSTATVTITGTVSTSSSSVSNTASASSNNPDPDGSNNSSTTTATVNHAPSCTGTSAGPDLWPPNHKWVWRTITGVTDVDGNPVTVTITGIRQDEPTNGLGDGDTAVDGQIGSGNSFAVRAERSGTGDGRVYHVYFTGTDGAGGSCTGSATIGVPHDQGPKGGPIDGGPLYNSLV